MSYHFSSTTKTHNKNYHAIDLSAMIVSVSSGKIVTKNGVATTVEVIAAAKDVRKLQGLLN